MKELICIICPRGCHLKVDDNKNVTGNFCPRGAKYAIEELTHPTRTLTSTVKIDSLNYDRLPVKTDKPLPKELIFKAMDEINKFIAHPPVHIGDILIHSVANTESNIVATKDILK